MNLSNRISFLLKGVCLIAVAVYLPDLFLYKGALEANTGISPDVLLIVSAIFLLILRTIFKSNLGIKTYAFLLFFLTPALLLGSILFRVLDSILYPNFTYGLIHVSPEVLGDVALYSTLFTVVLLDVNVVKRYWRLSIFSLGIISFSLYVYLKWKLPDVFYTLDREDSFLEYLQSALFLSSGVIAIKSLFIVRKLKVSKILKRFWLIILTVSALLLIALAGEEISWGQRIFNISTPEALSEVNQQNETTLHNVNFIFKYVYDAYLLMGIYGISSWLIFYAKFNIRKIKISEYLSPFISRWYLVPYFMVIVGYVVWRYALTDYHNVTAQYFGTNGFLVDNSFDIWEEAAELFPAIGILIIFIRGYMHFKARKATSLKKK